MALGDGEAVANFFKGDRAYGFQFFCDEARAAELRGQSHGEATCVGCGEQFFGVCADTVFKARAEGILRLFKSAAVGGNGAFTGFQIA